MLGKLVLVKHPEIAKDLLPFATATDTEDLKKIPEYFDKFCKTYNLEPEKIKGKLFKSENAKHRLLFISAITKIYNQNILYLPETMPIMKIGFVNALSEVTGIDKATTSFHIRQALFEQAHYDSFSEATQTAIEKLTNRGVEQLVSSLV